MNTVKKIVCAATLILMTNGGAVASETARMQQVIVACGECHGMDGISEDPTIPNLAGQDSLYMETQLMEFRNKPAQKLEPYQLYIRDSHIMDKQSDRFDMDDLAFISRHFSDMRCADDKRVAVEAQTSRCGECHGNNGFSLKPGIPNLAGQKESYLKAQLQTFRATMLERNKVLTNPSNIQEDKTGRRYHSIMGQWAARLSEVEMATAARYFSGLPGIWVCK